jgi:FkbM family methyltransferase
MTAAYISSVEGRWGRVHFIENDEYVGKSLRHYGEYAPDETELLLLLAEWIVGDRLILDIGANIGTIAQALARNGHRVEAFEPQPAVFEILRMNFAGRCHNVAAGSAHGTTVMPVLSYDEPNNFGAVPCGRRGPGGGYEVRVVPLDSFGYDDVGLMKIDVEGDEEEVLRGARETIARCSPLLYLEDDRPEKSASLHACLREMEYQWAEHTPPLFRPHNFFGNRENVWDKIYVSNNLLCSREHSR